MATPLINGINYSYANINFILFGVPVVGISKISYKKKQKKENNYGAGAEPVSRGYGHVEYEASIELFTDEWRRIIKNAPLQDPLRIPAFDIPIVYSGDGVTYSKDVLRSAEFMEDPLSGSTGDTKLMVTIPLIIAGIEHQVQ